ncbi:uncharacterized protein LOC127847153 [Dreissena polymorpha]|uniref:uncharacterized protein LOC127847153 n=1 Tax=Dreissena polymorpha TaxID=45954 RepID=UPI0022647FD7|nr:uncharacterized protein LOC127847153 [Dreissena polymorpha]XP_052234812.1 uncharacterized protein LOC127847153 [Dreissena polymorpha]XP_052234814.1 uncharacterized protein LOC127847153 [Dreissena polymorpha]
MSKPFFEITCANPIPVQHASLSYPGLSPGNSVTYTCEPGYIIVSGDVVRTFHGLGGWTGTKPKCQVQNCVTMQNNAAGKLNSGLYQINRGKMNFHIYCDYGNGDGYVYVSPSVPSDVDLNMASLSDDSSLVKVIHRRHDGKQSEATIKQITAFNTLPVSVQFNKNDGYTGILNAAMGPYVFTGFIPLFHNVKGGVQGWKVNGKEFTFTNCDGNPNSYFAVLFNAIKATYTSYKG